MEGIPEAVRQFLRLGDTVVPQLGPSIRLGEYPADEDLLIESE